MDLESEDVRQSPAEYFLAPDSPKFEEPFIPVKFEQPADWNAPIWRYMTIAKFLSLLDKRALFFARLDKLGDPFEGSITKYQEKLRQQLEKEWDGAVLHDTSRAMIESRINNTIVNCWHMNENESVSMWERYIKGSNEGVAVRSTYARLAFCFPKFDGRPKQRNEDGTDLQLFVRMGMVKYIDYDSYDGPIENICLLKRRGFEDEREVRAVVLDRSFMGDPHPTRFPRGGDYVPVDLTKLIETVYVAPGAAPWLTNTVESVVRKYGFDFPIKQSDLDRGPTH
jgi:hypothetical protein